MWSRDASSGTTPPYAACRSTWLCSAAAARRGKAAPAPATSATPVSSQEVSMPRTFNARAAESASASRHVKGYVLGRRERTGRVDFASDAARSSGPGRPAPTSSQRCLTARAGQARAVGRWKGRAVRLPAADGNGGNFDRAPPSHGDDAAANEAELFVVE